MTSEQKKKLEKIKAELERTMKRLQHLHESCQAFIKSIDKKDHK